MRPLRHRPPPWTDCAPRQVSGVDRGRPRFRARGVAKQPHQRLPTVTAVAARNQKRLVSPQPPTLAGAPAIPRTRNRQATAPAVADRPAVAVRPGRARPHTIAPGERISSPRDGHSVQMRHVRRSPKASTESGPGTGSWRKHRRSASATSRATRIPTRSARTTRPSAWSRRRPTGTRAAGPTPTTPTSTRSSPGRARPNTPRSRPRPSPCTSTSASTRAPSWRR